MELPALAAAWGHHAMRHRRGGQGPRPVSHPSCGASPTRDVDDPRGVRYPVFQPFSRAVRSLGGSLQTRQRLARAPVPRTACPPPARRQAHTGRGERAPVTPAAAGQRLRPRSASAEFVFRQNAIRRGTPVKRPNLPQPLQQILDADRSDPQLGARPPSRRGSGPGAGDEPPGGDGRPSPRAGIGWSTSKGPISSSGAGRRAPVPERYRLIWRDRDHREHIGHDPYCLPPQLPDFDLHLFGEGRHWHAYRFMGAHPHQTEGVDGVLFTVWAPSAERVSVVGDFNGWDGRVHPMRVRGQRSVGALYPGPWSGQSTNSKSAASTAPSI